MSKNQLLNHMVSLLLVLMEIAKIFSRMAISFYFLIHKVCVILFFPHPNKQLMLLLFFILAILYMAHHSFSDHLRPKSRGTPIEAFLTSSVKVDYSLPYAISAILLIIAF